VVDGTCHLADPRRRRPVENTAQRVEDVVGLAVDDLRGQVVVFEIDDEADDGFERLVEVGIGHFVGMVAGQKNVVAARWTREPRRSRPGRRGCYTDGPTTGKNTSIETPGTTMADPAIGLKLPTNGELPHEPVSKSAAAWGQHAESLGYDSIWMSEGWGVNAFVEMGSLAERTDDIRLCTAVVNTFSRTPTVLAMAGAALQQRSGGRAVLGVGPSHATLIEELHNVPYERPIRRTHEAIELVKELTGGGGNAGYSGELFEVEGYPAFEESVPVYNAALGPANRRATGRVADGWLPYIFPVSKLEDAFETIAETARETGRDSDELEVTPQILAAVTDDPEVAKDHVRSYVARYIGGLPNYRNALAGPFAAEAREIGEAWEADGLEAAKAHVTDELLFEVGVAGTVEEARSQFRDVLETDTVDCPIVYVPRNLPDHIRDRTIEALSPRRL